jgi:ferrochelatase
MSNQGVLLVNLGSPDSPSVKDVRRYLREFLMDGRVLDAPWPVRFFVVHALILPSRPKQSAEAYEAIWLPEGSPLILTSRRVQAKLQQRINLPVELGMRYQNPTIKHALDNLVCQGVEQCLLIPLFPHFAMSSYETAVQRVRELARQRHPHLHLTVQPPYYDRPDYIAALADTAKDFLQNDYDHLLFSFHGIPERHLRKSDPTRSHCLQQTNCCNTPSPAHATCYRAQCFATVDAFVKLTRTTRYSVAFQSRLGKEPWLTPYTDQEIERLAHDGIRKLLVICPAFTSDCLETIEEIGIRGRSAFLEAGGTDFHLIPCLNEHQAWIEALTKMVLDFAPEASAATATPHSIAPDG